MSSGRIYLTGLQGSALCFLCFLSAAMRCRARLTCTLSPYTLRMRRKLHHLATSANMLSPCHHSKIKTTKKSDFKNLEVFVVCCVCDSRLVKAICTDFCKKMKQMTSSFPSTVKWSRNCFICTNFIPALLSVWVFFPVCLFFCRRLYPVCQILFCVIMLISRLPGPQDTRNGFDSKACWNLLDNPRKRTKKQRLKKIE